MTRSHFAFGPAGKSGKVTSPTRQLAVGKKLVHETQKEVPHCSVRYVTGVPLQKMINLLVGSNKETPLLEVQTYMGHGGHSLPFRWKHLAKPSLAQSAASACHAVQQVQRLRGFFGRPVGQSASHCRSKRLKHFLMDAATSRGP